MTNDPSRVGELERRLGDPFDDTNPAGFAALLAADERAEMPAGAEQALDDYGFNAEFVPVELGGRLSRLDDVVAALRSLYRRDPSLGLGYGMSSFIASVNVWLAGDDRQRRTAADLILGNHRLAAAYHELAHGNDLTGAECALVDVDGTPVLRGRKEVVTNVRRARGMVLFARTDERPGSRSHSQILLDKRTLDPARLRDLPRFPSSGMRAVQLHGIEFADCPLPPDSILGRGRGLETAIRSFQITKTVTPAVMCGPVETGLRVALRHLTTRPLYGATAADLPHVRSALAGVFADLLLVECFGAAAVRAVHVLPDEASVLSAVYKHFGSAVLLDAMNTLSELLGAHFYLRTGPTAIFQKLLRDVRLVGFGHAARAACESIVLPQLPVLARRSWSAPHPEDAPAGLFDLDAPLGPLEFQRLGLSCGGRDHLTGSLTASVARLAGPAAALGELFLAEHAALTRACRDLGPADVTVTAGADAAGLVTRLGHVHAAASVLGLWRHNLGGGGLPDAPVWPHALLARLHGRLTGRPTALPPAAEEALHSELLDRFHTGRSFDLAVRPLPDGQGAART
ncbi:acyl-CoA dehydrogenase [Streptomyces acidiscabies]|uniref:acyl-CoA dehydrogenase n=1 Tax=Streptomyces acidiscabies TaxID=42234 RepID=UPI00073F21E2|nr:acyl-CoA dehydrogenase family protein [Streptomyces acidiscabies]GAQ50760.1 acyl-CoA dehydrogenase [Streptomyces acidiscabies]